MSQYLNSLLIEPVVRQARRFSRPSSDERPLYPVDRHLSSTENASDDGAEISLRDEGDQTLRSEAVRPENSRQVNLDRLAPQATETATAEPDAIPRYSEDSHEAEVRDLRHAQEPPRTSHEESWTSATRPDSAPPEEQISSNPVYDIPESLRSTTSSLGESIHSITDSDAVEVQVSARSSLQYPRAANGHPLQVGDGTLPADDGMSSMRKRIVAIHRTDSIQPIAAEPTGTSSPTSSFTRLGQDFFHCKTCCACLSIRTLENHRCIERSTDCDCPICGEYMFTSPQAVIFMKCGHSIHLQCYYEHAKRSYRCPICSKSMANMEPQFRQLERSIESQPMPPEFQNNKALVYCNDCNAKSSVKYHWLGLKCGVCDSYNTAQLQIIRGADPRSIPIDPAQSSPGSGPRDRATDPTAQASRAINPPSAAVVSPSQDLPRPAAEPSNLQGSPREVVATDEHRDSLEAISDEDYSDVNFWGFESPNARGPSASPERSREDGNKDETDSEDDGSDNDYAAPGDAEDDDDDNDEEDQMEIFGHR
ncbi:MAG: hypothetical protein Q9172_000521 [Xanthocarpia lactea]